MPGELKHTTVKRGPSKHFSFSNAQTSSSIVEFDDEYLNFKIACNSAGNIPVGATVRLVAVDNTDPTPLNLGIFLETGSALGTITPAQQPFDWSVRLGTGHKRFRLILSVATTGAVSVQITPYDRVEP